MCVRINTHRGWAHRQRVSTTFLTRKKTELFLVLLLVLWILSPTLYQLSHPVTVSKSQRHCHFSNNLSLVLPVCDHLSTGAHTTALTDIFLGYFVHFVFPMGIYPMRNSGRFPQGSQLQQSCYRTLIHYKVHAGHTDSESTQHF